MVLQGIVHGLKTVFIALENSMVMVIKKPQATGINMVGHHHKSPLVQLHGGQEEQIANGQLVKNPASFLPFICLLGFS